MQIPQSGLVPYESIDDLINNEVFCKWNGEMGSYLSWCVEFNETLSKLNQTPILCGIRDKKTGGYLATPTYCFAINENSKQKEKAYELLKILLHEGVQKEQNFRELVDVPVLNSAAESLYEFLINPPDRNVVGVTQEFLDSLKNILGNVTASSMIDLKWTEEVLKGATEDYLSGKLTEQQLVKGLESKTGLYLKE